MKAGQIDMNSGYSIIIPFIEWDKKTEAEYREGGGQPMLIMRDPILIGRFMNWLEQTEDGKEYVRQLAIYHKLMRGKK